MPEAQQPYCSLGDDEFPDIGKIPACQALTAEAHNTTVIDGADIVISMTRTDDDQVQELARLAG